MTDQQFEQLMQVLGAVGTQAYEAAYRQAYIDGIMALVVCILCMLIVILCCYLLYKLIKDDGGDSSELEIVLLIATGFCVVLFFITLYVALGCLMNPQWHAIQSLASLVK